ncbi:MAG: hypothetical protein JRD89_02065 [Deltaproteobacteria bacterium]|nr:hypothetical protein [Deltaproteobacteria bacterium]
MLSKRKTAIALANWIRTQLQDTFSVGQQSIKDDTNDGVSIFIDRVRQSGGTTISIDVSVVEDDNTRSFEFCLSVGDKSMVDKLLLKPGATPAELAEIDDTP